MLSHTLKAMEVHFAPDVEKKLNDLAAQSGRGADELLQDALAGYLDEARADAGNAQQPLRRTEEPQGETHGR